MREKSRRVAKKLSLKTYSMIKQCKTFVSRFGGSQSFIELKFLMMFKSLESHRMKSFGLLIIRVRDNVQKGKKFVAIVLSTYSL